jgi:hypothetical protein
MVTQVGVGAAISAAERGWAVFPCRRGDKRPAVGRWEQRACSDPGRVASHWPDGANVGIACGPSGLVVIDLDCHGELPADWRAIPGVVDGRDVFVLLLEWAGKNDWPSTYWVATPSGGYHLYFRAPAGSEIRNSAGLLGPGVDVRACGGYVVGAGSVVGGRAYEVLDGRDPQPLPGWLCRRLAPGPMPHHRASPQGSPSARLHGLADHVSAGEPGDRNGRLYWAACRVGELIAAGQASSVDADILVAAALNAGLRGGETEARNTVASGLRAGGTR